MLANAASLLREGHCCTIVIGNLRDTSSGELLDLHGDTKRALADAGCKLYNGARRAHDPLKWLLTPC